MRVLVVVEMVPEEIYFVDLDSPTDEELCVLEAAAGKYVNADDDEDAANQVIIWSGGKWNDETNSLDPSRWTDKVIKKVSKVDGPFDRVYLCGMVM